MAIALDFAALADLSAAFTPPSATALDDHALIEAQRTLAEIRRRVDAAASAVAAEIDHRSRRELGYDGLAQRLGFRTPELLVQRVTGSSSREARSFVRVGALMVDAASQDRPQVPWLAPVAAAVAAGRLSIEAAEAIRAGLGAPDDEVPAEALTAAAATLWGTLQPSPSSGSPPAPVICAPNSISTGSVIGRTSSASAATSTSFPKPMG
jgi:hypothetical protein